MSDAKFISLIIEMLKLLYKFRQTKDKSDKRVLRDTVRAMVKELTRV